MNEVTVLVTTAPALAPVEVATEVEVAVGVTIPLGPEGPRGPQGDPGIIVSPDPPPAPTVGTLWIDSSP